MAGGTEMRKWLLAATACLVLLPGGAFAAIYNFQSSETSALGDPTYSFALNTADTISNGSETSFSGVTIDDSGTTTIGNMVSFLTPTELSGPSFFFVDTDAPGPKAFGEGLGTNTTFNPGAFSIADGFTEGEGTLDISNISSSAAPEPSTWLLMIAGVGGIGLMLRRAKQTMGPRTGSKTR